MAPRRWARRWARTRTRTRGRSWEGDGRGAGSRGVRLRVRRGSRRHDGHVGEEGVKQTDAMGPFVAIGGKVAVSQLRQHIYVRHPLENLSWGGFAHVFPRTSDVGVIRAGGFEPVRARVSNISGNNLPTCPTIHHWYNCASRVSAGPPETPKSKIEQHFPLYRTACAETSLASGGSHPKKQPHTCCYIRFSVFIFCPLFVFLIPPLFFHQSKVGSILRAR